MTAPDPPSPSKSIDPLFVWNDKYLDELRGIAETDELPGGLDWPALREAIKVQIIKVVEEFQARPRSPWLHPAAREMMEQREAAAQAEGEASTSTSTSTAGNAAAALEDRFASSSSAGSSSSAPAAQSTATASDENDAPRPRRHSRQGARSGLSEGDEGDEAPRSPGSDDDDDVNDFDLPDVNANANLDLSSTGTITTATAADRSGYYPAKTAPPSTHGGSWGRQLTPSKQKEETCLCLQLQDGVEPSPPFTIQRLAEVLLDPQRFVRSAPKFTASLLRLLSVTAGHDDFPPVEPGVAPGAVNTVMMTNGGGAAGGAGDAQGVNGSVGAVVGAVELQRMTGPPSPMAEPIFSPIPFLQRPPSQQQQQGEGGEGAAAPAGQRDHGDDVPTLELGDLAHPVATAADTKAAIGSATTTTRNGGSGASGVVAEPPPAPVVLQSATSTTATSAGPKATSPPSQHPPPPPPAAPLGLSGIGPSELPASSSSSTPHQPLGVPPGRVDELDEYSGSGSTNTNANGTSNSGSGPSSSSISNGGGGAGGPGDPSGQGSSSSATSASDGGSAAEGHQYGREVHPLSSTTTTTPREAPPPPPMVDAVMADGEAGKGAGATKAKGEGRDGERMKEDDGNATADGGGHRAKRLKSEEPR